MKSKLIIAALLFAGACASVNAQEKTKYYTENGKDNIYVGVGIGGMTVLNGGMNSPTFNMNVTLGKHINPIWGVRGQIGGFWQSLEAQDNLFFSNGKDGYSDYCKKFVELNLDATLNLINLFSGYNPDRAFNLYVFGGPTMNIAKAVDVNAKIEGDKLVANPEKGGISEDGLKARFGATLGLGLGYDINDKWAVNLEGRFGVTPSIFGKASDCSSAEATARLNVGVAYTFGGKKFIPAGAKIDQDAINAEVNKYREELAQAQKALEDCKNAKPKEVVKEVVIEKTSANPMAVFFKIGSAKIDDYGKVNIQLIAKAMKADSTKKYKIAGYCDKATGSVATNQKLSEKRAQAVYDALIAEGVSKDQLELVGFGGTANMFGKDYLNRVVILE